MANFNDQYLRGLKAKDKPFRTMDTGKGAVDSLVIEHLTGGDFTTQVDVRID